MPVNMAIKGPNIVNCSVVTVF